mmetsp:Transcript_6486/g.13033  ORF Transcript_6486/g.13033 Transcript_6486/m.13033 type:complete len:257 (+) Transcript_6486:1408-2178(+)
MGAPAVVPCCTFAAGIWLATFFLAPSSELVDFRFLLASSACFWIFLEVVEGDWGACCFCPPPCFAFALIGFAPCSLLLVLLVLLVVPAAAVIAKVPIAACAVGAADAALLAIFVELLVVPVLPLPPPFPPTLNLTALGSSSVVLVGTITGAILFFPFLVFVTTWLARRSEALNEEAPEIVFIPPAADVLLTLMLSLLFSSSIPSICIALCTREFFPSLTFAPPLLTPKVFTQCVFISSSVIAGVGSSEGSNFIANM